MTKPDILLIYPQLGSWDNLVRDLPLSLLYAAVDSVKNGYKVQILDCRLYSDNWKDKLDILLSSGCDLVGLSVMTGNPISTSLRISKYIKENYDIPIVWGGPHPTILPEQTLENKYIDYIIRDWGSKPLYQLISFLKNSSVALTDIHGLGYKKNSKFILNQPTCQFEIPDYRDIPYHLVDIKSGDYNRQYDNKLYFPIFTAVGCPYKCTFCMSPAVYKKVKGKKWIPYEVDSILDHIEYLLKRYDFSNLQILDDDSFVDLNRMHDFFLKYIEKGFHKKLTLDFRGVRIDELDRMDNSYLELMEKANVGLLAIGVESGSDETLKRMGKEITVEQILRASRKLKKYLKFKPHYNIFCGIPGETYEDLLKTKELMEILVHENPNCLLGFAADWKPLPGSVMTETAVKDYNLKLPESLEAWAAIDSFDAKKIKHPWYTKEINNYIRLLQVAGTILGQKMEAVSGEKKTNVFNIFKLFNILVNLYRPILRIRLKYNLSSFLVEYHIRNFIMKLFSRF